MNSLVRHVSSAISMAPLTATLITIVLASMACDRDATAFRQGGGHREAVAADRHGATVSHCPDQPNVNT